eukprot:197632-Alexandrium_andersonii.AAC.1
MRCRLRSCGLLGFWSLQLSFEPEDSGERAFASRAPSERGAAAAQSCAHAPDITNRLRYIMQKGMVVSTDFTGVGGLENSL